MATIRAADPRLTTLDLRRPFDRRRVDRVSRALASNKLALSEGSIAFVRRIDQAAASMYALQHEILPAQGIPAQGTGREPYRS